MDFSASTKKALEELAAIADEAGNSGDAEQLRSLLSEKPPPDPATAYFESKYNVAAIRQRYGGGGQPTSEKKDK